MAYPLPTEHERRALFWWLEQASSLGAWRRLHSYHQSFLDAVQRVYEEEQSAPGARQTIPTGWYTTILDSHDAFGAALDRLRAGDRRCLDFLGARGHFSQGVLSVQWWQNMYAFSLYGRNGFEPADSPRWPEIEGPMHDCLAALSDIDVVLQDRHKDVPAPIRMVRPYRDDKTSSLMKWWLNQPDLPPVPVAEPECMIPTGSTIPLHGVWEPVQAARRSGFFGAFRSPLPAPAGGPPLDGCMNYLHGGSAAPTIAFEEDGQRQEGRPTSWRLVWHDDRYGPNPIPTKEQHYVFVRPVPGEVLFKYF